MTGIQERLFAARDEKYREFTMKLTPGVDPDSFIGVRLPAIRALAKELRGTAEAEGFLNTLPHEYYEENHLHSFLLYYIKDFDEAVGRLERFLPYIDNWSVCDSTRLSSVKKSPERLLPYIDKWLASGSTYTVRCAILCLMTYLLDDHFDPAYLEKVAAVRSEEYYVRMMIAWYFATALAKQYDAALPYIEGGRLDPWTHNKTIQKAVESYRITADKKEYLKKLKCRGGS